MPLTLSSFGDMFKPDTPQPQVVKGRRAPKSSSKIKLTAQGSRVSKGPRRG